MWHIAKRLKERGILSINQRNSELLLRYNERKHYPLVDDKLKTKTVLSNANINVPTLYAVIETEHELNSLDNLLKPFPAFVIKPAHGAGGDGIMVITERVQDRYRQINEHLMTSEDLRYHLSGLLSGIYSLGGHPDHALIERRILVNPIFDKISYKGVPDIRVITLLGYPAMAMVRLPTRLSNGKANLHQGAIGVGVNLSTGITQGGVFHNDTIDHHPDTLEPIAGIQLPFWDKVLEIAARCYELTGLGFLGVDIVLDKDEGPLVLELNARPGLNIQIANREGLLPRFRAIEEQAATNKADDVEKRIAFSKSAFSNETM